jgi:hypothetical protein
MIRTGLEKQTMCGGILAVVMGILVFGCVGAAEPGEDTGAGVGAQSEDDPLICRIEHPADGNGYLAVAPASLVNIPSDELLMSNPYWVFINQQGGTVSEENAVAAVHASDVEVGTSYYELPKDWTPEGEIPVIKVYSDTCAGGTRAWSSCEFLDSGTVVVSRQSEQCDVLCFAGACMTCAEAAAAKFEAERKTSTCQGNVSQCRRDACEVFSEQCAWVEHATTEGTCEAKQ